MIKINIKKIICLMLVTIFLISTNAFALKSVENNEIETLSSGPDDLDPLVDLKVTVTIKEIRAFDKIDIISNPDFYVKIFIDDAENTSTVWRNKKYVKPNWSATQNVSDYKENVNIKIQLWDWNPWMDKLCDISGNSQRDPNSHDIELIYSLKTGHWRGDDYIYPKSTVFDRSGYGRVNGCDDNSIYRRDRDCELWFEITQNDCDGDGIPYWTEVNIYGTDPTVDDRGRDDDEDGIPIEWEHKWGHYFSYNRSLDSWEHEWIYRPFEWDDHENLDPDVDGLDNIEEYRTSQWGSDPFRKDLFIELDQMEESPRGEKSLLLEGSKELLYIAHDRQNIVYHLDDGGWEESGSDMIPFDESTDDDELMHIYQDYFLCENESNWRRGVFHYGVVIYNSSRHPGFAFSGDGHCINSFQISSKGLKTRIKFPYTQRMRDIAYASAWMHETGHTLGIFSWNTPGCDNPLSIFPRKDWLKWLPYKSVMNYWYIYRIMDYSDGSRGKNDFDDWNRIDLTFFQTEFF